MFFLLSWMIYGLIVGCISTALISSGNNKIGWLPTIGIGIAGSYVGGFINWLLGAGITPFEPSGIIMGIIGGIVFCVLYRQYKSKEV